MQKQSLRTQVLAFAQEQLGCALECPFKKTPNYVVVRHPLNRKWAGIIMDIPARYICAGGDEVIDIMNIKLEPAMVSGLCGQPGYAPAWHMSKEHWITVQLDGTVPLDQVCALLEISYGLVGPKARHR